VTIHASDPFAEPDRNRSQVRRLRSRLPSAVSLWTAYDRDHRPAGLTVSSTMVIDGEPGEVLGVLDDEADLTDAVAQTGRFVVMPLGESDQRLADMFAGVMPAPGGAFRGREWRETAFGPVLDGVSGWAGCRLTAKRQVGWRLLVEATIDLVEVAAGDVAPLVHYRGRYSGLAAPASRQR
jgi:3-hydroxy-9,10-secoandrosta-1,3,5(10)-triene-9,17-dione monooxygenase reductase component